MFFFLRFWIAQWTWTVNVCWECEEQEQEKDGKKNKNKSHKWINLCWTYVLIPRSPFDTFIHRRPYGGQSAATHQQRYAVLYLLGAIRCPVSPTCDWKCRGSNCWSHISALRPESWRWSFLLPNLLFVLSISINVLVYPFSIYMQNTFLFHQTHLLKTSCCTWTVIQMVSLVYLQHFAFLPDWTKYFHPIWQEIQHVDRWSEGFYHQLCD